MSRTAIRGVSLFVISLAFLAAVAVAQAPPDPKYTYEVVSIHPAAPGQRGSRIGPGSQGGLRAQNVSVMQLLTTAYDVRAFQFVDAPSWVSSERYDVSFTPDKEDSLRGTAWRSPSAMRFSAAHASECRPCCATGSGWYCALRSA